MNHRLIMVAPYTLNMPLVHPCDDFFALRTFRDEVSDMNQMICVGVVRDLPHEPTETNQ